ncbi:MAG: MATE family efflux transporter [Candidatus Poribacteria bacterium]|nr:MATE family efflux transporter [Candidatus Poribacteria bacterium]
MSSRNSKTAMVKKLLRHKTFSVMVITFAGMGLSLLVRAILIPRRFGFTVTADELTAALTIVLVVDTIVREGAKFSLVPLFVTREKEMTRTEYRRFTNSLLFFLIGVGFGVFILIELLAPWIAGGLLRKSTINAQKGTTLLRLCAPLIIFGCGSTVLGAFLNSQQRFKTVALRNAIPAGITALVFLLLWNTQNLENWVALAYSGGFITYFGWLCIGAYRTGHRYEVTGISLDTLRSLKNTVTLPTLGFAVRQVTNRLLVEIYLVSHLGQGVVTLYKSAFQIFSALQTLIGISIATTGLPDMAADDAVNDKQKLGQTVSRNTRTAIIIAFPVTLFMLIFHGRISWLLYGRGDFDNASIELIGQLLFWLSTGMMFSCLIPVLNAGLYAQKAYRLVFANMVTMAALNFLIAYGLIETWWILGVALSISITALLAVGNLTYLLRRTRVSWL